MVSKYPFAGKVSLAKKALETLRKCLMGCTNSLQEMFLTRTYKPKVLAEKAFRELGFSRI